MRRFYFEIVLLLTLINFDLQHCMQTNYRRQSVWASTETTTISDEDANGLNAGTVSCFFKNF